MLCLEAEIPPRDLEDVGVHRDHALRAEAEERDAVRDLPARFAKF